MHRLGKMLAGDTMIEVFFAITAYSVVAIFTITTMKIGLQQGEAALELSQARIEISAQADAIRFIHNSFLAEREYNTNTGSESYVNLWKRIVNRAVDSNRSIPSLSTNSCSATYSQLSSANAFVINTRNIRPSSPSSTVINYSASTFHETQLYPRIIYKNATSSSDADYEDEGLFKTFSSAEGIWVIARKSASTSSLYVSLGGGLPTSQPEYYDFHIYSCWYAPGADHPSTTGTIVRLYNPALKESIR